MKLKNFFAKASALAVALSMTLGIAACNNKPTPGRTYDNETDTLVFSTLEVDGVFNPFFSTSVTDSSVVGMTQIGMLTNDKDGKVTYGDDQPVITKDLETRYDAETDTTTYYFVLKNNVRFSNGSYLSMKDVLFNYYVYLDPVYSGSSTIYSTDIVGLQEYRTQEADEEEQESFRDRFETMAEARISALAESATTILDEDSGVNYTEAMLREALAEYAKGFEGTGIDTFEHLVEDYDLALVRFREELETDYSNSLNSYEDIVFTAEIDGVEQEFRNLFTTDVEVFLYNEGYINWDRQEAELTCSFTTDPTEVKTWTKERAIQEVYDAMVPNDIAEIVQYWGTATTLFDEITNAEMTEYFEGRELTFPNIEGIKFANRTQPVTVNGITYQPPVYVDGEARTHVQEGYNEVLSITIEKVDPKAIWNFSLRIAPMYYYSDAEHIAAFDYEENFGVEYMDSNFMNDVVKNPDKVGVPVGAGPYAASSAAGGINASQITSGDFLSQNVIYFERNPYYVMGPATIKKVNYQVVSNSSMLNALYTGEIDFVQPNAKPETIDELNARRDEGIYNKSIETSGYGYIGINAGKVPTLEVRQAIMHAINTQECVNYYGTTAKAIYRSMSLSSWAYPHGATAYYPYIGGPVPENLSVVNPAYADFVAEKGKKAGDTFTEEEQEEFIRGLVEDAGYTLNSRGVYTDGTNTLKYTFTIAGEQTDHPAWLAMFKAGNFLNQCGFEINVTTDSNALKKLASGDLTVWAAAWSSTIDPDMYQVYHIDSNASSVLNWGYRQIKQNIGGKYNRELSLVEELSDIIDRARETEDTSIRSALYSDALDIVMQLAIELPTYQRDDLFAYNGNKIDVSTFTPDSELTSYMGLTNRLDKVSLVVA